MLEPKFEISIIAGRGGEAVKPDMFTPRINKPKKKKGADDDAKSENSDTPAQRAHKKQ